MTIDALNAAKFEYSRRRHFRIETTPGELRVELGKITRPPASFREECARAAVDIGNSTVEQIYVCLSGGIDAEIVCRAFLDAGLRDRVTPLILVWPDGLNAADVALATDFCQKFSLAREEKQVDVAQFFDGGFWTYCDDLRMPMGASVWKAWIADQHDGFLVVGDGWMPTYFDDKHDEIRLTIDSTHDNPFERIGRLGIPAFFRYHPELMLAILLDPDIFRWCVRCRMPLERLYDVLTFKYFALSKYYEREQHPLAFRVKRTGVEGLPSERAAFEDSQRKYGHLVGTKTWGYEELITEIGGEVVRPDGSRHPARSPSGGA